MTTRCGGVVLSWELSSDREASAGGGVPVECLVAGRRRGGRMSVGPFQVVSRLLARPGQSHCLHIQGNPVTVTSPTRLSDLVAPAGGTYDWAACRVVEGC